tara:strand:+ start:5599 stop:6066 length:468 start_codon:yes stop_codon:yes gene_type:complete
MESLYQDLVMEHNLQPLNFRKMDDSSSSADGFNPFCGDTVKVYLKVEDQNIKGTNEVESVIVNVSFEGSGCAISKSSASMMTEVIMGKTIKEAQDIIGQFNKAMTENIDGEPVDLPGDLGALCGVSRYPARVKCAVLSWHTLRSAMTGGESITTE